MAQATFDIGHITLGDDRLEAAVAIMPVLHWGPATVDGYEELLTTARQTIHLVAWRDDEPIGFAFAHTWPGGESDPYLLALLGVAAAHRRKGLGAALFRSLSTDARDLGKTGFRFEVLEDRADALEFLAHRGYSEIGRELQFELDLTAAGPSPAEPPPGVEIVTRAQDPELVRGMYALAHRVQQDIPGTEGEGDVVRFEDWYDFEIDRPGNLPELSFIAVHRGDVIGSASLQALGDVTHHGGTLVERAWRGRGVGRALTLRRSQLRSPPASGASTVRRRHGTSRCDACWSIWATDRSPASSSSGARSDDSGWGVPRRRRPG